MNGGFSGSAVPADVPRNCILDEQHQVYKYRVHSRVASRMNTLDLFKLDDRIARHLIIGTKIAFQAMTFSFLKISVALSQVGIISVLKYPASFICLLSVLYETPSAYACTPAR